MSTFLNRYINGEYEQVWEELYKEGEAIQQEPLLGDALAVTGETMRRVRNNIELLIHRLLALGYKFGTYPDGRTEIFGFSGSFHPPKANIVNEIAKLELLEGVGPLPLSLKVFWESVGDVDFMGYHPLWPEYSDPLVVYPIEVAKYEYKDWRYFVKEGDVEAGQFGIPLAPDFYHKDNVSGGDSYKIYTPNGAIDGIFENERLETTFVNYLRISFRHGGFPGVQWHKGIIPKELSKLSEGLIPI
jgi:hypothetical protein